jgi:hypothetical protein
VAPDTYVDITDMRRLDIRASAAPDLIQITGMAFADAGTNTGPNGVVLSGRLYTVTVTLAAALPERVVPGYALGLSNIFADDEANGGIIVETISSDRLTVTGRVRSHGVPMLASATLNTTIVSASFLPNQLVVPKACLRVLASPAVPGQSTWDGSAREGFLNALRGGRIDVQYLGIAYNGVTSEHDIAFAGGAGSIVNFRDRCVVVGAGDKVMRAASGGRITGHQRRQCRFHTLLDGLGLCVAHHRDGRLQRVPDVVPDQRWQSAAAHDLRQLAHRGHQFAPLARTAGRRRAEGLDRVGCALIHQTLHDADRCRRGYGARQSNHRGLHQPDAGGSGSGYEQCMADVTKRDFRTCQRRARCH